ncbi:MAG: hypothetical protein LHW45_06135 [Candidatus Cloacimonetes bacterium]|nr:hypothetical protein [Candidatus Cloacimonadota bacterium]MDY0367188.1 hypothetical protein [Candidatus Syntrophosphaera sp.]
MAENVIFHVYESAKDVNKKNGLAITEYVENFHHSGSSGYIDGFSKSGQGAELDD